MQELGPKQYQSGALKVHVLARILPMTRFEIRMNANILKNNAYEPQPPWATLENSSQTDKNLNVSAIPLRSLRTLR